MEHLRPVAGGLTNSTAQQVLKDAYLTTYGLYEGIDTNNPLASILVRSRDAVLPYHPVFNLQRRYAKYAPTFKELSIEFDDLLYNPRWIVDEWFAIALDLAEKRGKIADDLQQQLNNGKK